MPLHAHNSFTPIPAENKTTARTLRAPRARVPENPNCWKTILSRVFFFFSPSWFLERRRRASRSIQRRENVVVEKEKGGKGRREGTRGGAIKGSGKERELVKMLVPPSLGIFNYAKLPRDINNAGWYLRCWRCRRRRVAGTALNKVERRQVKLIRRSRALEICVPHRGVRCYVGLRGIVKSCHSNMLWTVSVHTFGNAWPLSWLDTFFHKERFVSCLCKKLN